MELSTRNEQNVVIVEAQGKLNAVTAAEFEKYLADAAQDQSRLVINMKGVDYISSAGLRALLVTAKTMKAKQGEVLISDLAASVAEVFEISGFSSIFRIFDSEEDAIKQS